MLCVNILEIIFQFLFLIESSHRDLPNNQQYSFVSSASSGTNPSFK